MKIYTPIQHQERSRSDRPRVKIDKWIYDEIKRISEMKSGVIMSISLQTLLTELSPIEKLTSQQRKALHLFFSQLAQALNMSGLDMRKMLKTEIWWTVHSVKEYLWRPLQKAMYGKRSTNDLEKQVEIDKIHEQLMKILGEKYGIEYIPFPSEEREDYEK